MTSAVTTIQSRSRTDLVGYLYAMIAIVCGSIASVMVKDAVATLEPVPLLAVRLMIASVLLWLILLVVFRQRLLLERRLLMGAIAAGIANSFSLTAFYLALVYVDASVAMVLYSTNPLVVLALLYFMGQPLTRRDSFRALLAIIGVTLLVGVGGQIAWQGVALLMVTSVMYSVHLIIVQRTLGGYSTVQVTPILVTTMAVCVSILYFFTSPPSEWFVFPTEGWIVILVTAIFTTVIARLALVASIQRIGSGQNALLSPVETLLSVLWATLFLGERLTPVQLVGGALVLISAVLVAQRRRPVVEAASIEG